MLDALKRENTKYDLIIITDLFELTDDIYNTLKGFKKYSMRTENFITSVNPKWNNVLRLFEYFKLKTVTSKRAYIHPKKISNIARSSGLKLIRFTKQISHSKFWNRYFIK